MRVMGDCWRYRLGWFAFPTGMVRRALSAEQGLVTYQLDAGEAGFGLVVDGGVALGLVVGMVRLGFGPEEPIAWFEGRVDEFLVALGWLVRVVIGQTQASGQCCRARPPRRPVSTGLKEGSAPGQQTATGARLILTNLDI